MYSFKDAIKQDHGSLPIDPDPLRQHPVRVQRSIYKTDEVEILAPARDSKEGNFNLDPGSNRLESASECSNC